jgi:hypothetical protein
MQVIGVHEVANLLILLPDRKFDPQPVRLTGAGLWCGDVQVNHKGAKLVVFT